MRRLLAGVRSLFRRHAAEQELDEEFQAYLEADVEARIRTGVSRDDAMRQARLSVGSGLEAVKDAVRDSGWETHIESVWTDVRIAIRKLRR